MRQQDESPSSTEPERQEEKGPGREGGRREVAREGGSEGGRRERGAGILAFLAGRRRVAEKKGKKRRSVGSEPLVTGVHCCSMG